MTGLLLLGPWTPLLFQGQEFGASSPFPVLRGHRRCFRARRDSEGRAEWLAPFLSLTEEESMENFACAG